MAVRRERASTEAQGPQRTLFCSHCLAVFITSSWWVVYLHVQLDDCARPAAAQSTPVSVHPSAPWPAQTTRSFGTAPQRRHALYDEENGGSSGRSLQRPSASAHSPRAPRHAPVQDAPGVLKQLRVARRVSARAPPLALAAQLAGAHARAPLALHLHDGDGDREVDQLVLLQVAEELLHQPVDLLLDGA